MYLKFMNHLVFMVIKVYDKLWKEIDELGIREMPVVKELKLWEETLKKIEN